MVRAPIPLMLSLSKHTPADGRIRHWVFVRAVSLSPLNEAKGLGALPERDASLEHDMDVAPRTLKRPWVFVSELGKYLRVVTLEDGETVHNAFPDRGFDE